MNASLTLNNLTEQSQEKDKHAEFMTHNIKWKKEKKKEKGKRERQNFVVVEYTDFHNVISDITSKIKNEKEKKKREMAKYLARLLDASGNWSQNSGASVLIDRVRSEKGHLLEST